jgi:hypothetical protein
LSQSVPGGWILLFLEDFSEAGGSIKIVRRPGILHLVLRGQAVLFGIWEISIEHAFNLALLENQGFLTLRWLVMVDRIKAIGNSTPLLDLNILTVLIDGRYICEEVVLLA